MSAAGSLEYQIGGDMAPLQSALQGAMKHLGSLGDQFEKIKGLAEGALGGIGKYAGIGGAIAVAAAEMNLLRESIAAASKAQVGGMQWENLFPTHAEAARVKKELSEMAEANGILMGPAVTGAKRLVALGDSADRVVEHMRMINDLAAGSGGNATVGDIAGIMAHTLQTGSVDGRMLRSLTEQGIPVIQMFMESTGKSANEVHRLLEAGSFGFNDLIKAIAGITAEGKRFHGAGAAMAKSLDFQWAVFKETVESTHKAIGKPMVGPLAEGAHLLSTWVVELKPISQMFGEISGMVTKIGVELLKLTPDVFGKLIGPMANVLKPMLVPENKDGTKKSWTEAFSEILKSAVPTLRIAYAMAADTRDDKKRFDVDPITGMAKSREKENSNMVDDLARIGLFVGGGGPAGEAYARDTANNTERTAVAMERLLANTMEGTKDTAFSGAGGTWD